MEPETALPFHKIWPLVPALSYVNRVYSISCLSLRSVLTFRHHVSLYTTGVLLPPQGPHFMCSVDRYTQKNLLRQAAKSSFFSPPQNALYFIVLPFFGS